MSGQHFNNSLSGSLASDRKAVSAASACGNLFRSRARCSQWLILLAGLALIGSLAGCKKDGPPVFKVHKVRGQVLFDGKPATGVTVVLNPDEGSFPPGVSPMAMTRDEGKFEIGSYTPGDGAPAGKYVVTLTWFKVIDAPSGPTPGPNVIPAKYATSENSPVKFTVEAKDLNEIPVIEISSAQ